MNDTSIKPISSITQSEVNTPVRTPMPAQTETIIQARQAAAQLEKAQAESKAESAGAGSLANVSIHFRVDEDTNDVTVFLVDRKTKKILRSIPASELQKLQVGDLLKLTA